VACEQKVLLNSGGISDQPGWFIELLSWFAPNYDMQKFMQKARMVLGTDDTSAKSKAGTRSKSGGQARARRR